MRATPSADTTPGKRRAAYDAYLTSRSWSLKRQQWYAAWLTAAGTEPRCLVCGRRWTLKAGHLHHTTYARLGAESLTDLVPLCRRDHRRLHALIDAHPSWRRAERPAATAAGLAALRRRDGGSGPRELSADAGP